MAAAVIMSTRLHVVDGSVLLPTFGRILDRVYCQFVLWKV